MNLLRVFFFSILLVSPAYGEEVRVIDPLGLIRAQRHIGADQTVDVLVQLHAVERAIHPEGLRLSGGRGVQTELEASGGQGGKYTFHKVTSGTWRLLLPDRETLLLSVKVGKPAGESKLNKDLTTEEEQATPVKQ